MEFRKLSEAEKDWAGKVLVRMNFGILGLRLLDDMRILIVSQEPYSMVSLWLRENRVVIGFAKLCTYAPQEDTWDAEIGIKIALSRAVRQMEAVDFLKGA